jgi:hypothetical protein
MSKRKMILPELTRIARERDWKPADDELRAAEAVIRAARAFHHAYMECPSDPSDAMEIIDMHVLVFRRALARLDRLTKGGKP